jgi:hypothetical protein
MKKLFIAFCSVFFLMAINISANAENNITTITSGKENHKSIIDAKQVYVYVTFNNTMLWKEGQTIDDFLMGRKNRGDKAKEDKEKMIAKFYKKMDGNLKLGFKWKLKRVEKPEEVKDGYIIYFNYDKCFPIVGVGAQGYGSIKVFKSDDQTKPVLEGEIKSFSMAKSFADFDPTYQFSEVGQRFAKELVKFLQNIDVE